MKPANRYSKLIEAIFFAHYRKGTTDFTFQREEIERHAAELKIRLPKNLGDLIYSFRYRVELPEKVQACAPADKEWAIEAAGKSKYRFVATAFRTIRPNRMLPVIKVPDATPGIIAMYSLNDEQALLARLRYNRLIDVFTRVTCYSLQSHLRTFVKGAGQVESDEVYVGVDRRGAQFVFPVQAKGGKDKLSAVQIRQDMALCAEKFPSLICRPIGAQFMGDDVISLFEFQQTPDGLNMIAESHYRLVPPDQVSPEELKGYGQAPAESADLG
jgi:hypothetical protein